MYLNSYHYYINMKNHFVISRYNENLDWVVNIDYNIYDVFIYNKGNKLTNSYNCKIIELDNIGRESHTYLFHIINNYYKLPEKIIFTQGYPFDHVQPSFINDVNNFIYNRNNFHYFSKDILSIKYVKESDNFIETGILNGNMWKNFHQLNSPIKKVMEKLFQNFDYKKLDILFGTGAIYGLNTKLILKHDQQFYLNCIEILNNSLNIVNPEEGHIFERLWFYIFNL